jgi:hypothetical protein
VVWHLFKPISDYLLGGSTFDTDEYLVRSASQVYPEFLIYYRYTG